MPQLRTHNSKKAAASVKRLQEGRPAGGNWHRSSLPPATECIAGTRCEHPPMPGCPVPLCAHHVREVHEFAQTYIDEHWLPAVVAMLDD